MSSRHRLTEQQALAFIPAASDFDQLDADWLLKSVLVAFLNPSFTLYRRELYRYLAAATALHAYRHAPFWRERLHPYRDMIEGGQPFELDQLPLLNRTDVEKAGASIFVPGQGHFPSYTSGTTSGKSLMLLHSSQAREVLRKALSGFYGRAARARGQAQPGFLLKLAFQALGNEPPGRGGVLPVISKLNAGMEKALDLLDHSAAASAEMRIHTISGNPFDIVDLSLCAMARFGDRFAALRESVRELHTTGTYVSRHLRGWLEDTWRADLIDAISFSELPVFANSCLHCGHHHFHPFCTVEVVDSAGRPLAEGRGRLALTALYPTVSSTHLMRYEVGDYVERREVRCVNGLEGYRFLGRYKGSVKLRPDQSEADFLGICEVIDLLDDLPDINRPVLKHNVGYDEPLRDFKHWPLFELKNEGSGPLVLSVELKYPQHAFPARRDEVEALIRRRFAERLPWFAGADDARRLAIEFRNPRRFVI
ncbi:MAG TPA: hypothetical protein VEA80_00985 [Vitreimonas sp.]|uniref:hypothetical protein n=1 Tax=Vitreimonas sp. TaxID=3069702 RepID=UPI002D5BA7D8|nr:hypothetical protein [Vitreimonas sp.]HYD86026.1 hypothetical protein [Vitreimonas sp.]